MCGCFYRTPLHVRLVGDTYSDASLPQMRKQYYKTSAKWVRLQSGTEVGGLKITRYQLFWHDICRQFIKNSCKSGCLFKILVDKQKRVKIYLSAWGSEAYTLIKTFFNGWTRVCIPLFNAKLPPQIKRPIHHLILRFLFSIPLDFKFYAGRCGESISQSRPIFTAPSADTWSWHRYHRRDLSGFLKRYPRIRFG